MQLRAPNLVVAVGLEPSRNLPFAKQEMIG